MTIIIDVIEEEEQFLKIEMDGKFIGCFDPSDADPSSVAATITTILTAVKIADGTLGQGTHVTINHSSWCDDVVYPSLEPLREFTPKKPLGSPRYYELLNKPDYLTTEESKEFLELNPNRVEQ